MTNFFTRTALRPAAFMLCLLALAGCHTLPTEPGAPPQALAYSPSIDIEGRFTTLYEQNGKPQSVSGSFTWNQAPQKTLVTLLSPLGQTEATIDVTPQGATLTQADRPPSRAADVDSLMQNTLGWPLPVAKLRDWMQGQVTEHGGNHLVATPQTTKTIDTDDGWRLQYLSWQDNPAGSGPSIPKRIDIERDTSYAGRVQMRLVISSWQPH